MLAYSSLENQLSDTSSKMIDLIGSLKNLSELPDPGFSDWLSVCSAVNRELRKNIVRIAVVGPIKSGKTTLVNSIVGKDYLKRGAGVVTSIVTRVKNSIEDQAILSLKNWEEINNEIKQAIILMPPLHKLFEKTELDIRQQKVRENLRLAISTLGPDQLITNDTRDRNAVMLSSYLKGYHQIKQYVSTKNTSITLEKERFLQHHDFISNDDLSIYLTDVLLRIKGTNPGKNVEIADCQGSDSPNPLHFSMIQNYLNIAHLIIYVISSRTGIRQADIKFLSIIKRMGILSNTIFVVNIDLNEHESLEDLNRVTKNIRENLNFISTSICQIFTFSALHNLTKLKKKTQNNNFSAAEVKTLECSVKEHALFQKTFKNKINHDRCFLLTNNHIQKLSIVSNSMENWIKLNQNVLTHNNNVVKKIITSMTISRSELLNVKTIIEGSIKGASEQVKNELFLDIDDFFDNRNYGLRKKITQFIKKWQFDLDSSLESKSSNLGKHLYNIFQEFRQAIEEHIAKAVNPNIVQFIKKQETKLSKRLEFLTMPYCSMFQSTIEKHNIKLRKLNISIKNNYNPIAVQNKPNLSRNYIELSPIVFDPIRFPIDIKTKAILYSNFRKITQYLLGFFGPFTTQKEDPELVALKKAINNIKKEAEHCVGFHLKNYKENIKFQHIVGIANSISKDLEEQISNHLNINTIALDKLEKLTNAGRQEKNTVLNSLENIKTKSKQIKKEIQTVKSQTSSLGNLTTQPPVNDPDNIN